MIELSVREVNPGTFEARVGDRVLVAHSRHPLLDAARALIKEGVAPGIIIQMISANGTPSLRCTVGTAARLTVQERDDGKHAPRFASHRPYGARQPRP